MSLDLSPTPDLAQDRSVGQDVAPDRNPVADLSRASGLPSKMLAALSPEERDGMASLEANVARTLHEAGRPGSDVTTEQVQALVEARNQVRDDVAGRSESPNGMQLADARVLIERDPESASRTLPPDARLQIRDQTITIESTVYLYGSGATQGIADTFERQIRAEWGQNPATGQPWTYTDPESGQTYDVQFDVNVEMYNPDNPGGTPGLFSGRFSPWNRDNFIEVTAENGRSYVRGGDEGQWRAHGRNGRTLANDNPAAHEFGHILGLPDRYFKSGPDEGKPRPGWENNIMGRAAGQGNVEQRDINALVGTHVGRAVLLEQRGGEGTYNGHINP